MELTTAEREKIYLEERAKREGDGGSSWLLVALTIGAIMGLATVITIANGSGKEVSIDDLRKAYPGLSPDEEQEP